MVEGPRGVEVFLLFTVRTILNLTARLHRTRPGCDNPPTLPEGSDRHGVSDHDVPSRTPESVLPGEEGDPSRPNRPGWCPRSPDFRFINRKGDPIHLDEVWSLSS